MRSRSPLLAVVGLAVLIGAALAYPHQVGGLDIADYCANTLQGSLAEHHDVWSSWSCVAPGGSATVDMQAACRQQYPARLGLFGGAQFAIHRDSGFASWACIGTAVHL